MGLSLAAWQSLALLAGRGHEAAAGLALGVCVGIPLIWALVAPVLCSARSAPKAERSRCPCSGVRSCGSMGRDGARVFEGSHPAVTPAQ